MKKGLIIGALLGMGFLVAQKAGAANGSGSSGSGSGSGSGSASGSGSGTRSGGPGGPASLPRGIRNNNPGNIRRNAANPWRGKVPFADSTDTAFEQFTTPVMGIRALLVLLRNYIGQGNNTLRKIISKWAPPSENATAGYISFAAQALGITPDRAISRDDATLLIRLAKAITQKENGQNPYTDKQFQDAWYYVNNPGIAGVGEIFEEPAKLVTAPAQLAKVSQAPPQTIEDYLGQWQ